MNIIVLGAGLVGAPIAMDLAKDGTHMVTVADRDRGAIERLEGAFGISTIEADLSADGSVRSIVAEYDFVIDALPGFMGYRALREIIEAGKDVVDIAFFPEDPFTLDELARKNNVTAIVDCGVAPGMSNILTGHAASMLDETENVLILVGGLPRERHWPFEYKAVFSPIDVIEEYTRPARLVENGHLVVKPPLTEREYVDFEGIGTLEAFNSDGLRTLTETIEAKNMREKTLRYPGHAERMLMLNEAGFFSTEPMEVNGAEIRPIDFTSQILLPNWKLEAGDVDFTVMRIIVEGRKGAERLRYTYDLLDQYDEATGIHSMARTTGYTATVAARMVIAGLYVKKGISPPEFIGTDPECVEFMLEGLRRRGIDYKESKTTGTY